MKKYPDWPQWPQNRPVVIAEVGINHGGDVALAWDMIQAAYEHGADFVKLQSFVADKFFHPSLSYFKNTEAMELTFEEQQSLFEKSASSGISLITTPYDTNSADMVDRFSPAAHKIASMDNDNYLLVEHVADKQRPLLLSLGMANLNEVQKAVEIISSTGNDKLVLMHCISDYPARPEDMQLAAIPGLAERFHQFVGLSDHSQGLDAAMAALALGAVVIEKHFTTNRSLAKQMPDADHDISIEPHELKRLRDYCDTIPSMLGSFPRELTENEKIGREEFRRGLYASRDIAAGETLSSENICFLRPVRGIRAGEWEHVQGRKAIRRIDKLASIMLSDVE